MNMAVRGHIVAAVFLTYCVVVSPMLESTPARNEAAMSHQCVKDEDATARYQTTHFFSKRFFYPMNPFRLLET